jgi:hypothetical protein
MPMIAVNAKSTDMFFHVNLVMANASPQGLTRAMAWSSSVTVNGLFSR